MITNLELEHVGFSYEKNITPSISNYNAFQEYGRIKGSQV
jgi:hypothetical protein